MCLSSSPNNGFLLKTSRSSLSGRVLTLERLQQVANSPKQHWLYWLWWCRWCWARGYGTSPQHPAQYVLSCSDVSRGPANHSVCGAPCCELANQSARTQVAFVRGVWDEAVKAPPMARLLMNRCGCRSALWWACLFIYWQLCFEKYEIKTQFVDKKKIRDRGQNVLENWQFY